MRSPDSDLQTAFNHCAERPTTTEETGEKKCAALRSAQKQALLCLRLNGWLLCSTKNLCAVTILNEITLLFETCHVSTCEFGHIPRKDIHVDTFGSFHAQRFFLPSPPHLHTLARYSPPPSPFLWVSAHHSVITSFAGRQFLPTIH